MFCNTFIGSFTKHIFIILYFQGAQLPATVYRKHDDNLRTGLLFRNKAKLVAPDERKYMSEVAIF